MDMITLFFMVTQIIWLFLPGIVANVAPVLAAKWWAAAPRPIWERGLGAHKTWRGLGTGVTAAGLTGALQWVITQASSLPISQSVGLTSLPVTVLFATALGFAALTGDSVKSFFKRYLDKSPGQSWRPWDQIDFVIGMIVAMWLVAPLSLLEIFLALLVLGGGSFIVSWVGIKVGVKKSL